MPKLFVARKEFEAVFLVPDSADPGTRDGMSEILRIADSAMRQHLRDVYDEEVDYASEMTYFPGGWSEDDVPYDLEGVDEGRELTIGQLLEEAKQKEAQAQLAAELEERQGKLFEGDGDQDAAKDASGDGGDTPG